MARPWQFEIVEDRLEQAVTIDELKADDELFEKVVGRIERNREQFDVSRFHADGLHGEGIKVGILDTGIEMDHPALRFAKVVETKNFVDDEDLGADHVDTRIVAERHQCIAGVKDPGEFPAHDCNGHGTHCAGIIVGHHVSWPVKRGKAGDGAGKIDEDERERTLPFLGVAPKVELYVARVLNAHGKARTTYITSGFMWLTGVAGVDIVSMSLTAEQAYAKLARHIHYAIGAGKVVVAAAGNSGSARRQNIGYPGRYGAVITVAASNLSGQPTDFSSRGGEIDMSAPGESIWSPVNNHAFKAMSGTSMAAPYIAGLSALLLQKHKRDSGGKTPVRNGEEMREHLLRMAAHPGHHDQNAGYGALWPPQYFWLRDQQARTSTPTTS